MKTVMVLFVIPGLWFLIGMYIFLTETITRNFSQKVGQAEISAVFTGPRHLWILNKNRLIYKKCLWVGPRPNCKLDDIKIMSWALPAGAISPTDEQEE